MVLKNKNDELSVRSIKKTKTIGDLRRRALAIADDQYEKYQESGDTRQLIVALAGYKQAIDAFRSQLIYMKLTGSDKESPFCKE